ncbi:hypothetical protein LOK49_LG06G00539 [Camellia lanceoleosa]|uniref:Uncharacterized protein n=1 Tax=Camellia lanceoleosa TaxID=1840588 RepID=A0ACC0HHT9_9ERIC|nr:hypothetical protein LOK49_LG06G00539 [Camellia lanceoleosa]
MLTRFITRSSQCRLLTLISSPNHISNPKHHHPLHTLLSPIPNPSCNFSFFIVRCFSSNHNNNDGNNNKKNSNDQPTSTTDLWKISRENDQTVDSVFGTLEGSDAKPENDPWLRASADGVDTEEDIFKGIDKEVKTGEEDWATADDDYKPWTLAEEEKSEVDVFDIGPELSEMRVGDGDSDERVEIDKSEQVKKLEEEEKMLSLVLKGPNRAFGDLVAASGITDAMLDSLIALKDLDGVQGLPPLKEIEDMRYLKNTRKSTRAEIERQKQEEVANARVRQVDEKGRAYGTGRRKCSVARVWIQPGDGKFVVNDKEFDVYFPMLDHRAALLRPFSETKTLGLWDISCTVKGGGVTGQVGAIQLGISKALQNWEPDLRSPLRAVGFLTRDPRVVERKKPGKAKARKSFQWVKR